MLYLFEEYELDDQDFCLTRNGQRVPLEPKSLRVLLLLVSSSGKLVEKGAILDAAWKETFVGEATLTRAIALLRKQLGDDSRSPKFIETVPTLGYRFIAKVEARLSAIPPPVRIQELAESSDAATATPADHPPQAPWSEPVSIPTRSLFRPVFFWIGVAAAITLLALALAAWLPTLRANAPLDAQQVTDSPEPKEGPLFTDGARLYFESRGVPVETPISGGAQSPMPALEPGMSLLDLTPDGSTVLAMKIDLGDTSGRGTLWQTPALGGTPRQITNRLVTCARWTLDGRSVIFSDQKTLYSIDANGENERKIWDTSGYIFQVAISPDAKQIAATLGYPGTPRLWMIQSDGKNAHTLPMDWPSDATQESAQWTPNGSHFLFTSHREGHSNVYEFVNPHWLEFWKKPSVVRLTGDQVLTVATAPSPDSKSLYVLGRLQRGAMHEFDPRLNRFVACCNELSASEFIISPNRRWMVYREYPTSYLWRSRLDGSEKLQLTHTSSVMEQWSPDSKWVVYSAGYDKLYRVSADGSTPEKLIDHGEKYEVSPTWSHDGKSIAFHNFPETNQLSKGIQILDLATRKVSVMPGTRGFYYPSWSPDGRFMVAISQDPSQMMLYSSETQSWKTIHKFDAPWGNWAWSSDSKSLYLAQVSGQNGLYRLTVPEGSWNKIGTFNGINLPPMPLANSFVSLTAQGTPAMMSDTSVSQIYALRWPR